MKLTMNKEEKAMQFTKKKVVAAALAICLIAVGSMGTLAWFSDTDAVTNEFMVAGSESGDPDDIFSVDVWEDLDGNGVKDEGNGQFDKILPGDVLDKVVHVENTGSYDEYIRVKITVTDAAIWQDVYDANMVPVTEFVDINLDALYGVGSYLEGDNFVYYLYYNDILSHEDGNDLIVFEHAYIAEQLTREQAAKLADGKFEITITADAVQTANVGENVYEAFETVGMVDETSDVNTIWVGDLNGLLGAFANGGYVVMTDDITLEKNKQEIKADVNLYLNECTLNTSDEQYGLNVNTGVELTIGGYGTVYVQGGYGILVHGTCSIFGGTYLDDADQSNWSDETLINIYADGTLNIYNGTFEGVDYCVNVRKDSGTANIYGGTYSVENANGQTIKY